MHNFEACDAFLSLFPLYQHLGLTVESAGEGGVYRCRVPLTAQTGNHIQTVHAAVQWAVSEVLGGIVVITTIDPNDLPKIYGAVKSATIDFVRPARTDITAETLVPPAESERIRSLIAEAKEARFALDATLRDTAGTTVATFRGEYVVRPRRV